MPDTALVVNALRNRAMPQPLQPVNPGPPPASPDMNLAVLRRLLMQQKPPQGAY